MYNLTYSLRVMWIHYFKIMIKYNILIIKVDFVLEQQMKNRKSAKNISTVKLQTNKLYKSKV